MVLAEMATKLREVSERYGGIPDYLSAAGEIDRTASEFFKNQDMDSLRALNGAVARAHGLTKKVAASVGVAE